MAKKSSVKKYSDNSWWQEEIRSAKRFRDRYGKFAMWKDLKMYHRNEFDDDIVPYNLTHINLRSTLPKLYYKDPRIIVRLIV